MNKYELRQKKIEERCLGERILALRKARRMSQLKLAEKINKHLGKDIDAESTRFRISTWENDRGIPTIEEYIAMSDILGVDVEFLLGTQNVLQKEIANIADATGLDYNTCLHLTVLPQNVLSLLDILIAHSGTLALLEQGLNDLSCATKRLNAQTSQDIINGLQDQIRSGFKPLLPEYEVKMAELGIDRAIRTLENELKEVYILAAKK